MFLESYISSVSGICFFQKKQMSLHGASPCVSGVIYVICEWHLLFPEKANVTPRGLCLCFLTRICHVWVAFAFSRKSKCDSTGPMLVFLDSDLSCVSGICFFWKKQMWLLGLCWCFWTHICHLWVAFAFSRKSKCDSYGPLLVFLDSYMSSVSGICFFRKKQMWVLGASAGVSAVISVICAFLEKANATHRWQIWVQKH